MLSDSVAIKLYLKFFFGDILLGHVLSVPHSPCKSATEEERRRRRRLEVRGGVKMRRREGGRGLRDGGGAREGTWRATQWRF